MLHEATTPRHKSKQYFLKLLICLSILQFVPGYPKTGVWYEFYDPTLITNVGVNDVQWNITSWGKCSRKCAKGKGGFFPLKNQDSS